MQLRRPSPSAAYTLIEVLVAISILALAIGAASRLSLSQALTEEINQKEAFAVNYAENAARLWQLGIDDPTSFLLRSLNSDGTLMSVTISTATAANGGDDGPAGTFAVMTERTNIRVTYKPAKYTTPTSSDSARTQINDTVFLDFPILRQVSSRR